MLGITMGVQLHPQVVKSDSTSKKRWSDTEANTWMSHTASSSRLETSVTKAKKRWSTFGPTMIKLLDKMLLPEGQSVWIHSSWLMT